RDARGEGAAFGAEQGALASIPGQPGTTMFPVRADEGNVPAATAAPACLLPIARRAVSAGASDPGGARPAAGGAACLRTAACRAAAGCRYHLHRRGASSATGRRRTRA